MDYELDYDIRGHRVELKAQAGKRPKVIIDGESASANKLSVDAREYLPSNVFVYYSGKNERIEGLFQAHQQRFNRRMEITAEEYLPEQQVVGLTDEEELAKAIADRERFLKMYAEYEQVIVGEPVEPLPSIKRELEEQLKVIDEYKRRIEAQVEARAEYKRRADRQRERLGEDQLRRLFYCRGGHSQLVLLACMLSKDDAFTQLLKDLDIVELDSALFVIKQPYRLRRELDEKDILEGDNRFWYARGNVVSEFLDKLWQLAVAPIEHTASKLIDFRGRTERQEQLYLFLPDKEKLQELGALVGEAERFFRYAEAAYIGDLIEEVRITVKHKGADGNISFNQLSEGELQLLTVLGLMRITSQDHCLFLLDEPDTHLNPIWKLRYFDEIEKVLRRNATQTVAGNSQIIITTHDPMMIGSLRREQVRILRKDRGKSVVETPFEHPQGMGVAGLLKSEMFGLPSTLDAPTLRDLEERNELLAKKAKEGLSEADEAKLARLRRHLDDLGFSREYRDPMYQLFIEKMYEVRSQPLTKLLTPDELKEQEALAQAIVTELVKTDRASELSALAQELKLKLGG